MSERLTHRGPDNTGFWQDDAAGIGLAHCRLSILDLSPAGNQPMTSPSGRFRLVMNGEIYNHLILRRDLGSIPWRGHSDTETLLAAIDTWGLSTTLDRIVGMFAFALWDGQTRTLTLVRDRFGEKPLYYGQVKKGLVFASELKALRAFPGCDNPIDRQALTLFVRHNYIPTPWTCYERIWKLPSGCCATFQSQDVLRHDRGRIQPYWSALETARQGLESPFEGNDHEAVDELEKVLHQSLEGQMLADVPLGAFLSGGIDSTTVVALMQAQSSRPIKTFTIGFHHGEYNEAEHARAVAHHLGTDHTEWYLTGRDALDIIPELPEIYDEPFGDASQIPTHLLSLLTRQHVTVALSGDGGDELFGGYNRYFWTMNLWHTLKRIPSRLRPLLSKAIQTLSPVMWDRLFRAFGPLLPGGHLRYTAPGDKLHKLAYLLTADHPRDIYTRLISPWRDPSDLVVDGIEPCSALLDPEGWPDFPAFEQNMMLMDTISYLPDDILTKVDRAAMATSLETRVPMLDHRVFAFAWRLPLSLKIRGNEGKWILRRVLERFVPASLFERPKAGFAIPLADWLRGPLQPWAEDLLDPNRLKQEGFWNPRPIAQKWQEHLSGQRNWGHQLWGILMFQAWLHHKR